MKTIDEIRLDNARKLIARAGNQRKLIDKLGTTSSQMSQMVGANPRKKIGGIVARRFEVALGLESGWMDQEHVTDDPQAVAMARIFQELYEAADDKSKAKMLAQIDMVIELAKTGSDAQD
jgi:hypothetical protein